MFNDNGPSSIAAKLTMGMKYWWTACAVFMIRPCFTIGIKIEDESDIIRYWINGRQKWDANYIRLNMDFIVCMNKSNVRVKNIHLYCAILCGH